MKNPTPRRPYTAPVAIPADMNTPIPANSSKNPMKSITDPQMK